MAQSHPIGCDWGRPGPNHTPSGCDWGRPGPSHAPSGCDWGRPGPSHTPIGCDWGRPFVRGQETLEELVAWSNSPGEVVDGFARPRASYMAVETEEDGTFNPRFVHWNTTHRAVRGPRVPDMPAQLRLAEAREAKQRFEAATAPSVVATLAATHTGTAAGPLQGLMGDAAARPAVAELASGRVHRPSSGPEADEASVAARGVGGTPVPKGERSRSRTRMEGEDEVGSVAAVAAGPAGQEASPPGIAAGAAGGSQGSSERVSRAVALGSTQSRGRSLSRSALEAACPTFGGAPAGRFRELSHAVGLHGQCGGGGGGSGGGDGG